MRISITTPHKKYPIVIEPKAWQLFKFPATVRKNMVVITDTTVQRKYAKLLKPYAVISFPAGETNKRLSTIEALADKLVKLGADRSTTLVAFGGGVVGDMAGFLAATYMRGIPFYQVPTSLLAMVDASVGGKTGVNLANGKNLLGSFHQPETVLIDPTILVDLPEDEFRNGMGEVVKHAVLDSKLFSWLERNAAAIQARNVKVLSTMITKNVRIKADIVNADEKEKNMRMLLNLGHTFGHALEKLSNYTIPHGEAVAMGLLYAANYAKLSETERLEKLLVQFGLPTHLETPFTAKQMVKAMLSDKKNSGSTITLVLPEFIGDIRVKKGVPSSTVERFIIKYHANLR